jgi:UPF0716 protein FxsA
MPFLVLLVLFVVVPIVEIYVIIQVGQAIGALWTIALLIADSVAGTLLMKSQGRAAWRRFQLALSEGRVPAREVMDGVLVIFGGAFLLTPGFVTDILGALLLLPPTRAVIRRLISRRFTLAVVSGRPGPMGPGRVRRRPGEDFDVDGTAHDVDPDPRRLP